MLTVHLTERYDLDRASTQLACICSIHTLKNTKLLWMWGCFFFSILKTVSLSGWNLSLSFSQNASRTHLPSLLVSNLNKFDSFPLSKREKGGKSSGSKSRVFLLTYWFDSPISLPAFDQEKKNTLKGVKNWILAYTAPLLFVTTLWLVFLKDYTLNNLKREVNGVITTIIPFKIIILLFFMSILPSPFREPIFPAVSRRRKVCRAPSQEKRLNGVFYQTGLREFTDSRNSICTERLEQNVPWTFFPPPPLRPCFHWSMMEI